MNTAKSSHFVLALFCATVIGWPFSVRAQTTSSTYTGPDNGNWNDPMNWAPTVVPNNSAGMTFDVTLDSKTVNLDIDATVSSLTMPANDPTVYLLSTDHSFKASATDEVAFGDIEFTADQTNVVCDLGNFAAYSNNRLDENAWFIAVSAAVGRTARLQFNGADVTSNNGAPGFMGPGNAIITDENGLDAFRNMTTNEPLGFFQVGPGAGSHYTVAKSVTNEGLFILVDGATLTFAQNLTQVGDLRDPNDQGGGFLEGHSATAALPSRFIVNGALTNYDPATKTLHFGRYNLAGTGDGVVTLKVLGGAPLDIVNNDASIALVGQSAILDLNGADALRNLATYNRFRIGDHNFTTVGSLTSNSAPTAILTTRRNSHFTVNGNLSVLGGSLEVSPLDFDRNATPGNSDMNVTGTFSIANGAKLHFEVLGPSATGTMSVAGNADLHGALEIFVLPNAPIMTSGSLTLLTAGTITGSFSNVASGGRVTAYTITSFNGPLGTFNGVAAGSFKVVYNNNSLVISDYIPLLQLSAAASRKMHGSAGTFDVPLPLTGTAGVECRSGNNGSHTLVFNFTNPIVSGSASVTSGTGSVTGPPSFSGKTMTVNLTGVLNAQTIGIKLSGVTDSFSQMLPDTTISAGFLLGDSNGDRSVNGGDAIQVRNLSGQTVTPATFRSDINHDGAINVGDAILARRQSGSALTP